VDSFQNRHIARYPHIVAHSNGRRFVGLLIDQLLPRDLMVAVHQVNKWRDEAVIADLDQSAGKNEDVIANRRSFANLDFRQLVASTKLSSFFYDYLIAYADIFGKAHKFDTLVDVYVLPQQSQQTRSPQRPDAMSKSEFEMLP
jgi:hypothetical protein